MPRDLVAGSGLAFERGTHMLKADGVIEYAFRNAVFGGLEVSLRVINCPANSQEARPL
jgi:hypothetical protein